MERRAKVRPKVGLHARPAADFVKAVGGGGISVTIGRPGEQSVDARSILAVLTLGLTQGEEVVLSADGPLADTVLDNLVGVLEAAED